MIIILNGPLGIGKTQTSWALEGDIGTPIDTTSLTIEQAADAILRQIKSDTTFG